MNETTTVLQPRDISSHRPRHPFLPSVECVLNPLVALWKCNHLQEAVGLVRQERRKSLYLGLDLSGPLPKLNLDDLQRDGAPNPHVPPPTALNFVSRGTQHLEDSYEDPKPL